MSKTLSIKPRMSEKSYGLSQTENTYVFDVPKTSNKLTIAQAVEEQFGVTVVGVRVAVQTGKVKKSYKKRSRPVAGQRADAKRAYVRLKAGDSLPFFAAVEQEEKQEKEAAKTTDAKKPEKKAKTKKATPQPQAEVQQKRGGLRGVFNRGSRQTQNRGGEK